MRQALRSQNGTWKHQHVISLLYEKLALIKKFPFHDSLKYICTYIWEAFFSIKDETLQPKKQYGRTREKFSNMDFDGFSLKNSKSGQPS